MAPITSTLFSVQGLVAVVTGGGTGIGKMIATALASNGATVYIVGRRIEVLQNTAHEFKGEGEIIPVQCNIVKQQDLLALVDTVKIKHGYIDLLVNNSAISRNLLPHPLPSPDTATDSNSSLQALQDTLWTCGSPSDWEDTFETNVTALYYTSVAFLGLLHAGNQRRSSSDHPTPHTTSQILTISSSGAFRHDANVLTLSYTLSKSSGMQLGKILANMLAPWSIRSNVVAPGVFPSGKIRHPEPVQPQLIHSSLEATTMSRDGVTLNPDKLAANDPLKRAGTAGDIAGIVLFLCSKAGSYANGAVFLVDGGRYRELASPV